MFGKRVKKETYDRENQIPVIRASICTGEQTAGFKDIRTGRFTEIMALRSPGDRQEFLEKYEIKEGELKKEW